jgi:hypothetical protein
MLIEDTTMKNTIIARGREKDIKNLVLQELLQLVVVQINKLRMPRLTRFINVSNEYNGR